MAISYPLSFPDDLPPSSATIRGRSAVAVAQSPFTFQQQVYEHQGQVWQLEATWDPLPRFVIQPLLSKLLSLNGRRGTFLFGDPAAATPQGTWAGAPLVNGAGQTGQELAIDGLDEGATGIAGDYIQIGNRLYQLTADFEADASGAATLDIWPRLRESPADDAPIITTNCKGLFRLAMNETPWSITPPDFYSISINAVEAI